MFAMGIGWWSSVMVGVRRGGSVGRRSVPFFGLRDGESEKQKVIHGTLCSLDGPFTDPRVHGALYGHVSWLAGRGQNPLSVWL